jgi:predicted ATPase with chaperone activity
MRGAIVCMMTATVLSGVLSGLEAMPVMVEVCIGDRAGQLDIEGVRESAKAEICAAVRCALRSSGFEAPKTETVVHVIPDLGHLAGVGMELPIAVGILAASGQIPRAWLGERGKSSPVIVGELTMDGWVRDMRGHVAYGRLAAAMGRSLVAGTRARGGMTYEGVRGLADFASGMPELRRPTPAPAVDVEVYECGGMADALKLASVCAVLGGHATLVEGSAWKDVAQLVRELMGKPSEEERRDIELVHSVAGFDSDDGRRPLRMPHCSISRAGLYGGGRPIMPGEVTLANHGVLALDDVGDMAWQGTLRGMRGVVDDHVVTIARASEVVVYPADFRLVMGTPSLRLSPSIAGDVYRLAEVTVRSDAVCDLGLAEFGTEALANVAETARAFRETRVEAGVDTQDMGEWSPMERVARTVADVELSRDVTSRHLDIAEDVLSGGPGTLAEKAALDLSGHVRLAEARRLGRGRGRHA